MSFMKCFDVAKMVIENANEKFSPLWEPDEKTLDIFESYCNAIDALADEFGGVSYEVEVNEENFEITVVLECDKAIAQSSEHTLYELIKRSVRYGFSVSKDGTLLVKFVFPGIWDRA